MALMKIGTDHYNGNASHVYLLVGRAVRDAEDRPVNGKDHAQVSIASHNDENGNTTFINVNGWRNSYPHVLAVCKGDTILACGPLKKREYNGKVYFDLDADFIARSGVAGAAGDPIDSIDPIIHELPSIDPDGDLPF